MHRRTNQQVTKDILELLSQCGGSSRATYIITKTNINTKTFKQLIVPLINKGYVNSVFVKERKKQWHIYAITKVGLDYLVALLSQLKRDVYENY